MGKSCFRWFFLILLLCLFSNFAFAAIPTSLGFSTYSVLGATNTTYNVTFANLTSISQIINATINFTYIINITNNENVTRVYNVTVNTTNSSGFTSGVSTWANGTLMSGSNWLVLNLSTNTSYNFTIVINGTMGGTYLTNVFATLYDNASIRLNSSDDIGYITTAVDVTAPTINLVSPVNNSWSNDNTTGFTFNFTDDYSTTANCTLYTNSTLNNATLQVSNNTNAVLTANNSLMNGAWTWNISCRDLYGNAATSIVRIVNIDTVNPRVSDTKPANGTLINSSTFNFNFSYADASPTATCVLYVDGSAANSTAANNNTNTTLLAALTDGIKSWQVNCTDNATNMGNSTLWVVNVDSTNPTATINNVNSRASSGLWTSNLSLIINFTANDTNIVNWTLGVYNATLALLTNWTDTVNNLSAALNYTVITNGTYYVNLTVIDNRSHLTSTQFTIGVDTENPAINSLAVSGITSTGGTLTINATDGVSSVNHCNYSGAGSGTMTLSTGLYTATLSSLTASTSYNVNVTCYDNASNIVSNTTSFTTLASSSSSSSSSSGGSQNLGSAGGISTGTEGTFAKTIWASINSGEIASINVVDGEIGITKIEFGLTQTAWGAWMQVQKLDHLSSDIAHFDGKAYKYIEVTKGLALKDEILISSKINFKVKKTWLAENKLTKEQVAMFRYNDGKWNELKTTIGIEDSTYVNYVAETPGFSYFTIGEKKMTTPLTAVPLTEQVPETAVAEEIVPKDVTEAENKNLTWLWIVIALIIIAVILVALILKKRRA